MIKKLGLLAATSFGVAPAMAVYWNAATYCADCTAMSFDLDNVVRSMGEEGAVAGMIFFLGGLFGLSLDRSTKAFDHG